MQKLFSLFSIFFLIINTYSQVKYGNPEVNPTTIQSNFENWLHYQNSNIMLSIDFVALDTSNNIISKDRFLNELTQGTTIPIKLESNDAHCYYKLFNIEPTADSNIKATMAQNAFEEYEHFKMEGELFPKFNFLDLNGTIISNETMKGKIVVIKCWYIHCPACIKEFPSVNALVKKYENRKDILFISLAEDTPDQLSAFLSKKPLSYLVIPNMKTYMNETLHLNSFPTHFILNKQGRISKVLLNYESLEEALKKEIEK